MAEGNKWFNAVDLTARLKEILQSMMNDSDVMMRILNNDPRKFERINSKGLADGELDKAMEHNVKIDEEERKYKVELHTALLQMREKLASYLITTLEMEAIHRVSESYGNPYKLVETTKEMADNKGNSRGSTVRETEIAFKQLRQEPTETTNEYLSR